MRPPASAAVAPAGKLVPAAPGAPPLAAKPTPQPSQALTPPVAPSAPAGSLRAPPVNPPIKPPLTLPEPAFGQKPPALPPPLASIAARPAPTVAARPISAPPPPAPLSLPKPQFGQTPRPQPAAGSGGGACVLPPRFSPDNELIFQIDTQRHEMSDTIVGYHYRGTTFLPLGEMARFLDLAITVSDDGHYASGWVLDPKHTISVNLRDHTITMDGVSRKLEACDAAAYEGELYLNAARFPELFPLNLEISLRGQSILVKTRQPFPFEERAARDEARDQLASRRGGDNAKRWPREETPWLPFSFPLGDAETRIGADSTIGPRIEQDLRLASDLAWLTSKLFLGGSTRYGLTAANLEMGRRDSAANLLGPLRATDFRFGDIANPPMPVGLGAANGRGAFVTNAPLERASVFDTVDFRGDLPTGYEVELYRNGLLIDSTKNAVDGQYRFMRVPVDFGLNLFRLVFYGPQGQRREQLRQIAVGDGRLAKGELVYSAGLLQKSVNVLGVRPPNFIAGQDFGAWRGSVQLQYGLSGGVTLAASAAAYQSLGQERWLAGLGLRTGLAGVAAKLDFAVADRGGRAAELSLGGRLAGFSYKLVHAEYGGGFSDEVRAFTNEPLRRASELSINGALRLGGGSHPLTIPTYGFARQISFADGRALTNVAFHQSVSPLRGWMASNTLNYNRTLAVGQAAHQDVTGAFDLATMSGGRTNFRGTLAYGLRKGARATSAMVEVDHRINDQTTLRASLGRLFATGQTIVGASAVRRFERFMLALDGNYSTGTNQYATMLRFSMGFGRNPFTGRMFMAQPGLANGGAAAIRAFRDNNGDGLYDAGDVVLPGVPFNTGAEHAVTDRAGTALLGRLGDGLRTNFQVDAEALPDVSLAPVTRGVEIAPRAGRIHVSNFPIVALSELDGRAYYLGAAKAGEPPVEKAVSGLVLLLVDAQGKRVGRTRTASDGSFWFEQVRAGQYRLMLDSAQAASLHIRMLGEGAISIGNKGQTERAVVRVESSGTGKSAP